MDVDAPKPASSDQIVPKFSVNGLSFPSLSNAVPFMFLQSFFTKENENTAFSSGTLMIDAIDIFVLNFTSAPAVEIGANAAWLAPRGLHSL